MHHRPSGPPFSARILGLLTRWSLRLRARIGRLAAGALLTATVVGLVLAIPVVSGAGSDGAEPVTLDAATSSAASSADSPVVMGRDGSPLTSSTFAGATTSGTAHSDSASGGSPEPEPDEPTVAPDTTGSAPAASPPGTTQAGRSTSSSAGSPSTSASTGTTDPTTEQPAPTEEPTPQPAVDLGPAAEVLALINAERADAGCGALVADAGLTATAQAHSAAMSAADELSLDGLDRSGSAATIAEGRPNARSVVSTWLSDPADRAAILDCARTSVGIGTADGWWTQLLA